MEPTTTGVATPKRLPKIQNLRWAVLCKSLVEKRELWDYAQSKGVPTLEGPVHYKSHGGMPYREDNDLGIAWYETERQAYPSGLMSAEPDHTMPIKVTAEHFKLMCDAYKTRTL